MVAIVILIQQGSENNVRWAIGIVRGSHHGMICEVGRTLRVVASEVTARLHLHHRLEHCHRGLLQKGKKATFFSTVDDGDA